MSVTPVLGALSEVSKVSKFEALQIAAASKFTTPVDAARLTPIQFLGIPALNSLPGATNTIYLDFDGHVQATWNRTDRSQTYNNINAGASNYSSAEIRKIWETVAEDFAPFNVNVTTVEPPAASANVLRVVITGSVTADLVTGTNTSVSLSGDTFITNDGGKTLTGNTGYAAANSFTSAEPNVVYVFGRILRNRAVGTAESNTLNLAAAVANTVSHEAAHSFGLVHHSGFDLAGNASDYHVGSRMTTPIMGEVLVGDRTLWTTYKSTDDNKNHDSMAELTTALGARPDDYANSAWSAGQLKFSGGALLTSTATATGVIETTSDQDWFKFSTSGGIVDINLSTVEFANLDAKLELYRVTSTMFGPMVSLVASVDPMGVSGPLAGTAFIGGVRVNPFSSLGASYSGNLAAGDYMIAVKSHGSYGDVGNYTLQVSKSNLNALVSGISYMSPASKAISQLVAATGGAGSTAITAASTARPVNSSVTKISAADAIFGALGTSAATTTPKIATLPAANLAASVDAVLQPSAFANRFASLWA